MTSIDDLFRKPNLPSKRKLEVSHDPSNFYKSAKHTANGDAKGGAYATVEDAPDDEDVEAGPAPPPEDDGDEAEDDEDGRFFGGGVDSGGRAALDFVDARDGEAAFKEEKYDSAWLRKFALAFEKKISKNSELRAKFEDDPHKFMASEADLDESIKQLSILSEHPELYAEFAELGCVASLVSLLTHENADIAIDATQIINELVDEDVDATQEQWNALVDVAIDSDLLYLLFQNFDRLDENEEADRGGVYNILSILESLASQPKLADKIGKDTKILKWLFSRIQKEESPMSQNKQYAAEMLSILVQSSSQNRQSLIKRDAVDIMLQLLAPYRRNDPEGDPSEEEYVENIFDALTCIVDEVEGKQKFCDAEGVELALIMIREGKMSKLRAARLLDHAVGTTKGTPVCSRIVEAQGLKTLFGIFMKKHDASITEHLLGIFAALLRNLPGDSAERIRTLAKFMEKDYAKVEKLVTIRRGLAPRVEMVDKQISQERKQLSKEEQEEMELEWLSRRLEAGLYSLQTVDIILGWLVAEDAGAKKKIAQLLQERDESLKDIQVTLKDQLTGIVDTDEEAISTKEMLEVLIDCLT